jgi:hypothetical protein
MGAKPTAAFSEGPISDVGQRSLRSRLQGHHGQFYELAQADFPATDGPPPPG